MSRSWLGVVAAAHVRRGVSLGIGQINHGSRSGLMRMAPGDTLIYYSPTAERGEKTPLREFTAIGTIADDEIWLANEGDFKPYRRRVDYLDARPVPLGEVKGLLKLTSDRGWGYQLRLGLVPLDADDARIIQESMLQR